MSSDDIENLSGDLSGPLLMSSSKGHQQGMDLKQRILSLNLSGPVAAQWLHTRRQNIRPWSVFLATSRFKSPVNPTLVPQRIAKNLAYFQSNYVFVFLGLVAYCLFVIYAVHPITSPFLLLTLAATAGACYIVRLKNENQRVKILGHELTIVQQYGLVILCAVPFFLFAGAGSAVFWITGASFVLIMMHASFFAIETLNLGPEDEMSFAMPMETV